MIAYYYLTLLDALPITLDRPKLNDVSVQRLGIDLVGRLGGVRAHLEDERHRAAPELLAQEHLQLRLQAADGFRQLDDRLEVAVVERADFDGVVRAVFLGYGVTKSGHAYDHSASILRSVPARNL